MGAAGVKQSESLRATYQLVHRTLAEALGDARARLVAMHPHDPATIDRMVAVAVIKTAPACLKCLLGDGEDSDTTDDLVEELVAEYQEAKEKGCAPVGRPFRRS